MKKKNFTSEQIDTIIQYLNTKNKLDEIEKRASEYYDELLAFSEIKIESSNEDEIKRLNDAKEVFVNVIRNHFMTYKTKILVAQNPKNLFAGLRTQEVDISKVPDSKIDEVIKLYASSAAFLLHILKPHNKKLETEFNKYKALAKKIKTQLKRAEKEKALLHRELDKELADDGRKPKKNFKLYLSEFYTTNNYKENQTLNDIDLAKVMRKWLENNYYKPYKESYIRSEITRNSNLKPYPQK